MGCEGTPIAGADHQYAIMTSSRDTNTAEAKVGRQIRSQACLTPLLRGTQKLQKCGDLLLCPVDIGKAQPTL